MNKYQPVQKEPIGLSIKAKTRINLALIIALAIFFTLVSWPNLPANIPGSSFFSKFYPHLGLDLQGGTHLVYEANLSDIPTTDQSSALEGARDVIERRVNTLGVAEPIVQTTKKGSSSRLIVELAGVQDVNEAINLIGETPLLEFKELAEVETEEEELSSSEEISEVIEANQESEELAKELIGRIKNGESFAELASQYSDDQANKEAGGDLGWVTRGLFVPAFDAAIFDQLAVDELTTTPIKTEFGYHIIKKLGERTNEAGELEVQSSHILLRSASLNDAPVDWINTELSGKHLELAQVIFEHQANQPQVNLKFNGEGANLFEEITSRNIGKQVAIFLDGVIISAPVVQTAISGGQAVISGDFELTEAKLLTQRLNAGALPVPIDLLSQQTIGATLGNDSLVKSLYAGLIGLILVAIFMVAYYFLPGILSVFALLLYSVITIGLFETIPVTLTLAGIAGFILSVGMAVDANILIFERIKEEIRAGNSYTAAVEEGFSRAWSSIRDSNISSLITVVILYWFGASIIKGFAVTLGIGVLISMFSAITVTRTLLRLTVKFKFGQKRWIFGIRDKKNA